MKTSHERYRQIFIEHLGFKNASDVSKRDQLYDMIGEKLRTLASQDQSFDLVAELEALDDEYAALCANPAAYFANNQKPAAGLVTPDSHGAPQHQQNPSRLDTAGMDQMAGASAVPPPVVASSGKGSGSGRGLLLGALAAFALSMLATAEVLTCGIAVKRCSTSAWVPASSGTSYVLRIPHGLGVVPSAVNILFSPNENGLPAYPIDIAWTPQTTGNPVTVAVTDAEVELHMFKTAHLRGVFDAKTESWLTFPKGFIRVHAQR